MKYIRIIAILLITVLIFCFLFHVLITNFSLNESSEIEQLREAVKITFESKEIDMENSDELIDIIRRSKKSSGWRNLPTYQPKEYIFFYDESNEIIHSLTFYPNEYDIGFNNRRERRIAKEDRERFLEILNYKSN